MNQISTEDFKQLVLENKQYILGTKIRVGKAVWKFAGAGNEKLMFRSKKSGLDVTKNSEGKFWVRYKNVNPIIKGALLSEIQKAKAINKSVIDEINGISEGEKDVSIKKSYNQIREEIGTEKAIQKTAKQLGFIPANEIDLY